MIQGAKKKDANGALMLTFIFMSSIRDISEMLQISERRDTPVRRK